ncbi:hypothetical protein AB205_0091980 [Aquarana catesbeiana]|uniref:Uncharacterized protein n=1 Tax=Aquarana catesbeiana TaxID=8400 RepID=A0A2G9QL87_AQUCT|nr:hypothetical protein AB205_0091980 [Aquarana catesbeiana]
MYSLPLCHFSLFPQKSMKIKLATSGMAFTPSMKTDSSKTDSGCSQSSLSCPPVVGVP